MVELLKSIICNHLIHEIQQKATITKSPLVESVITKDTQIPTYAWVGGVGLDIDKCIMSLHYYGD